MNKIDCRIENDGNDCVLEARIYGHQILEPYTITDSTEITGSETGPELMRKVLNIMNKGEES